MRICYNEGKKDKHLNGSGQQNYWYQKKQHFVVSVFIH